MEIVWQLPAGVTFTFIYKTHISIENANYDSIPTFLLKESVLARSKFPFEKVKFDYVLGDRLGLIYKKSEY